MNNNRTELVARHSILTLLSDDEVSRVSTAETGLALSNGEEYLDLEQLDLGVRVAAGSPTPMGHVLPRAAVGKTTWSKVLTQLEAYRIATAHFGVGRGSCQPGSQG